MKKIVYFSLIFVLILMIITPMHVKAIKCEDVDFYSCNDAIDDDGNHCTLTNDDSPKCVAVKGSNAYYEDINKKNDERENSKYINGSDSYDNYDASGDVTCGGLTFNKSIANITYYFVLVFQIFGPVALIIWGMIDLFKGITSNKDDEIKKGQAAFMKRLITAVFMFLIITIVKILIVYLSTNTILDCFNCFVNGAKSCK